MLTSSFASMSAPFASSASTTAKWPFKEARCSGVHPFCGAREHRGQRLHPRARTHARTHARMHSLTLPIAHTYMHARRYTRYTHTKYTDTCTHTHTSASTMWRAGVGKDILHSLQRLIVDRVSLWARA
jgi:hypothetical protein